MATNDNLEINLSEEISKQEEEEKQKKLKEQMRQEQIKKRNEAIIKLVMSQTDYNEEQSMEKLKKWNNNYLYVIKEYLNPNFQEKPPSPKKTKNQMVMGEIRNFMDDVSRKYEQRKQLAKKREELIKRYMEYQEKQKNEQQQNEQQQNQKIDGSNNVIHEENTTEKKELSPTTE